MGKKYSETLYVKNYHQNVNLRKVIWYSIGVNSILLGIYCKCFRFGELYDLIALSCFFMVLAVEPNATDTRKVANNTGTIWIYVLMFTSLFGFAIYGLRIYWLIPVIVIEFLLGFRRLLLDTNSLLLRNIQKKYRKIQKREKEIFEKTLMKLKKEKD